jgi:ATP-dependent Clp protease protease subunit
VPEDEEETEAQPAAKPAKKAATVQNTIAGIKARLQEQNALLNEAMAALETANAQLKKTRTEVRNEIKSTYTPEGSKRSNKAKTEPTPFFAPQSALAQNAVKKAVDDLK